MSNSKIFCNVPWTNVHIYWDGSFGACCSEKEPPYPKEQWDNFNLRTHTVQDWFNLAPMKELRREMLGDSTIHSCRGCTFEESKGYESRRIKENFKTIIFTKQSFDRSYRESNWHERFESARTGADQQSPIDWHVDWGNECNLSCKMCRPIASSIIAGKYRKWNIEFPERKNWTSDPQAWNNFIASVNSSTIRRMHFMGGEPMLSKRFKELVDYLIATERNKTMSISFVTNGTILEQAFIDKLKTFKTFDIEISLESFSDNNHYIRQGLGNSTSLTVNNIKTLSAQQTDSFHVVLRSVPQLLNVNNYNEYIDTAWESRLPIQGIPLTSPDYLAIKVLPLQLRQTFVDRYQQVIYKIKKTPLTKFTTFTTGRDVSRLDLQLVNEAEAIISMLQEPEPDNVLELRAELCSWLQRWDNEFGLTAYDYYPEYRDFLQNIGYGISS